MSVNRSSTAILIPAYEPDEKLTAYIKNLIDFGFSNLIIVNDGSSSSCAEIFNEARSHKECTVISYDINQGKGYALKTGFQYFLDNLPECSGIITADADGQHRAEDAAAIADMMSENSDSLILGVRDFDGEDIPTRSRFGNKTTSVVFKLTHGASVSDTQTGLRGIPRSLVPQMLEVSGNRYEYEMNMLIECADNNIPMKETPIETIYIDENASSHFRPVRDSMRIYSIILKKPLLYVISSLSSFVIDILVFSLLVHFLPKDFSDISVLGIVTLGILTSTVFARIVSSLYNYFINRTVVFKSKTSTGLSMLKYFCLCAVQMLISAVLVTNVLRLLNLDGSFVATVVKCVVDTVLFLISYHIQRKWVFSNSSDNN